jgi:hypothetical protein
MNHSDDFFTPRLLHTAMGLPPTTRHRYGPDTDPIGLHIFLWFEAPFVFHMNHSDDFFTPRLLHTAMGHPPTTRHRYGPDTDPIGVHIFVW